MMRTILALLCLGATAAAAGPARGPVAADLGFPRGWVEGGVLAVELRNTTGEEICLDVAHDTAYRTEVWRGEERVPTPAIHIGKRGECLPVGPGQTRRFEVDTQYRYPARKARDRVCHLIIYTIGDPARLVEDTFCAQAER